jgi:methyltransferase (TIGR00027 family)
MEPARASKTAEAAAAGRASHFLFDAEPKVFNDPYAIMLTSPAWRRIVQNRLLRWLIVKQFYRRLLPGVAGEVLARSRYAEDRLEAALAKGIRQYVLLGAGLDSFAVRRRDLVATLQVFELDHPLTQASKREALSRLGLEVPKNVTFVPIDFEGQTIPDALAQSPFKRNECAFFSWLGTTFYLTKEAVTETLTSVASFSAQGSEIVFDYFEQVIFTGKLASKATKRAMKFTARRGEPFRSGWEANTLDVELRKLGLELLENLSPDELQARYFWGRRDGLRSMDHAFFAWARVVR